MSSPVSDRLAPTVIFPQALCAEVDPELFFPEKGHSTKPAKMICNKCVEIEACLEDALLHIERFGVRGGLSERERRVLVKERANV